MRQRSQVTPALRSSARALVLVLAVFGGAGCTESVFHCASDDECDDDGAAGICATPGYCAFNSDSCATGLAYGKLAPNDLSGECVPPGAESSTGEATGSGVGPTGGGTEPPVESSGASQGDASNSSGAAACPPGEPCDPGDPCAVGGRCSADGACEPSLMVACDDPPSDCFEPVGVCSLGECDYAPLAMGDTCDDGDACTVGDACDGFGTCVAGDLCPNADPCQTASCVAGECVLAPVADGSSCGAEAAARCCSGACVDISSDTAHCGGCNTACHPGLDCESISETATCELSAEATSGRCRCQFSNAQCPNDQICRTFTPFTDRCVPPSEDNCAGTAFYQNSCPSFCGY